MLHNLQLTRHAANEYGFGVKIAKWFNSIHFNLISISHFTFTFTQAVLIVQVA